MLGAATLELVRDAVRVKAVKPRTKTPLPAFRLLELVAGAPSVARYLEAELVGREDELRHLLAVFEEAKREPPSQVVAVVGEPGIGKTRLANELIALVERDATMLTGRCVSYGEGATYLPLREMVDGLDLGSSWRRQRMPSSSRSACSSWWGSRKARHRPAKARGPSAAFSRRSHAGSRYCSCSRTCTGRSRRCST